MTGEELYLMYATERGHEGVAVDPWHDLGQVDQDVWDALADQYSGGRDVAANVQTAGGNRLRALGYGPGAKR